MIHYVSTNGIGNAWVAEEFLAVRRAGIPCVLHSMRPPHQNFFGSEEARRVNAETRLLYPLPPLRLALSLLLAPLLFHVRFAACLGNALCAPRENRRARAACIAHLAVACDWARRLRGERVDLIHAQWIQSSGTIGWYAARLLGVPFSFTGHAVDLFRERVALRDKIRDAAFIVCISEFHRRFYVEEGAEPSKLHVVYCGIDTTDFGFRERRPAPRPRVLSFGRLVEKKGMDTLVEACALLRGRGVAFECEIAGDGPEEARLRALVAERELGDTVTITGRPLLQEDIPEWLAGGHVFAQPCCWSHDNDVDGIPRSLMEAMASGLPAVSTRIAGIPDLVEDDVSGLLVEPRDANALAAALERLLTDAPLAARLARGGRERVLERFDLRTCLEPLFALFRARLRGGAAQPGYHRTAAQVNL